MGRNAQERRTHITECIVCEKDISHRPKHSKFCNDICKRKAHRTTPEYRAYAARNTVRWKYGIDYDEVFAAQGGRCAICGDTQEGKRLAVDHCHETNKVRDLLCLRCNVGIGQFLDTPARLRAAADYLERHAKGETP